jgi:PAS domain S-box-containing protein
MSAELSADEATRLEALRSYSILDTAPEQAYNDIAQLASQICAAPISLISFIGQDRQWFKAQVGLDLTEAPRPLSFCAHAILHPHETLVVPDALRDPRFCGDPLVQVEGGVRFYGGAPLVTPEGHAVGTLCVLDCVERPLSSRQQEGLRALARQVMALLELRKSQSGLRQRNLELERAEKELREREDRFRCLIQYGSDMIGLLSAEGTHFYVSDSVQQWLGYRPDELVGHSVFSLIHPEDLPRVLGTFEAVLADGQVQARKFRVRAADGEWHWIDSVATNMLDRPSVQAIVVNSRDITESKRAEDAVRERESLFRQLLDSFPNGSVNIFDTELRYLLATGKGMEEAGLAPETLVGKTVAEIYPPDQVAYIEPFYRRALAGEEVQFDFSYSGRYYTINGSPLRDETGGVYALVAVAYDTTERKQAEVELHLQKTLLEAQSETSPDGILIVSDEGRMLSWNQRFLEMWGISTELVAQGDETLAIQTALDALEDPRQFREKVEYLYSHKDEHSSDELILRDGRVFDRYSAPVQDTTGHYFGRVWYFRDITQRKENERAVRESEERFQFMAMTSGAALYQLRYDSLAQMRSEALVYDYLSPAITKLTGYSPEEINAIGFRNIIERVEGSVLYAEFPDEETRDRVRNKGEYWADYLVRTKQGEAKWLGDHSFPWRDGNGEVIGSVGILNDITERRHAQEQVREREEFQRTLLENFPNGFVLVFDQQWHYIMAMGQGLKQREVLPEHLLGKSLDEVLTPEEWAFFKPYLEQALAGNIAAFEVPYERGWYNINVAPLANPQGEITRILAVMQDITQHKESQAALLRLRDELEERVQERTAELEHSNVELQVAKEEAEQANRAKSEFLSRMSHELRTPLNAILGFGQILEAQELSPLQEESVAHILKGGHHLLDLINEVLDIARVESGKLSLSLEPVEVSDILTQCCSMLAPVAKQRQISIVLHPSSLESVCIQADTQRLKQVVLNLLSNAIKYSHGGGVVTVAVQPMPCADQSQGHIRLLVQDTGAGIAPEDLSRLFMPFERLGAETSNVTGTGLGLALSKSLVEAMGGRIGLESILGSGTTAWVELPGSFDPMASAFPVLGEHAGASTRATKTLANPHTASVTDSVITHTVLLIEDNLVNLRLVEHLFLDRPYVRLLSTMQGRLGLELTQQHQIDLILLDVHLPDINGDEVLRRLKEDPATASIPVVVVSADATFSQIERLKAAGAHAYLTKPLNLYLFQKTIDPLLRGSPKLVQRLS